MLRRNQILEGSEFMMSNIIKNYIFPLQPSKITSVVNEKILYLIVNCFTLEHRQLHKNDLVKRNLKVLDK